MRKVIVLHLADLVLPGPVFAEVGHHGGLAKTLANLGLGLQKMEPLRVRPLIPGDPATGACCEKTGAAKSSAQGEGS